MPKYKLLNGSHSYGGVTYYKNDPLEVSEEHAERFGGKERFQLITEGKAQKTTDPNEDLVKEIGVLLEMNVPDIEKELETVNDRSVLDLIQKEENKNKQRAGVLNAIKARKDKIA
jgi:hypothetical protein